MRQRRLDGQQAVHPLLLLRRRPALESDERLDVGGVPYRDTTVEYPVLTGGFMWLTADLTRGVHAIDSSPSELVVFGALTALLLSLCGLVVTAATAQTSRGRPWDAAIFALSPLLVFHAFTNWDLLAMAFTVSGIVGVGPANDRCCPGR